MRKHTDKCNAIAFPLDELEQEALDCLRRLLNGESDLICPLDDPYLLRFLRYKKGDVARALEAIVAWWKDRHRLALAFDGIYPSRFLTQYKSKFFLPLGQRDKFGRQIVLCKIRSWDPSQFTPLDMFRSNFPVMEIMGDRQLTQLNGVVYIADMRGLGFNYVRLYSPTQAKMVLDLCEGFPLKIKEVHIIFHPRILNTVWGMIKVFLKPKLKSRIHFHGDSLSSLHKSVDPSILPIEYGGSLDDEEWEEEGFVNEMLDKDEYFKGLYDATQFGYDVTSYGKCD